MKQNLSLENQPLYGHQSILKSLFSSVSSGNLSSALLFLGPSGIGKSKVASVLVQRLLCSSSESPCDQCPSCQQLRAGSHPDVLWITPDGLSIKVSVLAQLRSFVSIQSFSKKRLVIIDEAHTMNPQVQNGLLKLLEEPPRGVHFILICNAAHKLLSTIRSRVQDIRFQPLTIEDLQKIYPNEDLQLLQLCKGQADRLDKLKSLEDVSIQANIFWKNFCNKKLIPASFTSLVRKREQAINMARMFQELLRDARIVKEGADGLIHFNQKNFLLGLSQLSRSKIDKLFQKSIQLEKDVSSGLDTVLCFENFYHQYSGKA